MAQQREFKPSDITDLLSTWANNFTTQTSSAFSRMKLTDYIRLVTIIGAYALLRPYLMKIGAKLQHRAHERDSAASVELTPNDLRDGPKIALPGVDSDDDEDENITEPVGTGDWGRNARIRQRKMIRQRLEDHERRLLEETEAESDKDIQEFLVD